MQKKLTILSLCFCFSMRLSAQQFVGLSNSNYAGTNGVYLNPSSIADSRYSVYVNLITANGNYSNTYYNYNGSMLSAIGKGDFFSKDVIEERLNGRPKLATASAEVRLPSFMVRIDSKRSFAITTRTRVFAQVNNLSQDLARVIAFGTDDERTRDVPFLNKQFNFNSQAYTELGVTYAQVLMDQQQHFLKGGLTLKRVAGLYAGYLSSAGFDYQINQNGDGKEVFNAQNVDVKMGFSREDANLSGNDFGQATPFGKAPGSGWGFDLGLTYEFRPDIASHRYTVDNAERLDNRNKYKYRVGIAITDIGNVVYNNPQQVHAYSIKRQQVSIGSDQFENSDADNISGTMEEVLQIKPEEKSTTLKMGLPTALKINGDYHVKGKFYAGAQWVQNMRSKQAISSRQFSYLSVMPRLELRWVEVSMPLSVVNNYQNFAWGLNAKIGPLMVGSDNLAGMMSMGKPYGLDAYVGLAFGVGGKYQKKVNKSVVNVPGSN